MITFKRLIPPNFQTGTFQDSQPILK